MTGPAALEDDGPLAEETNDMTEEFPPPRSSKRPAPPEIEPVVIGDVRYEQVRNALDLGFDQLTGYLRARDAGTGEDLWVRQVYAVVIDESKERDVQEVYFASMTAGGDGASLIIENERGERFSVDAGTGESTPLSE